MKNIYSLNIPENWGEVKFSQFIGLQNLKFNDPLEDPIELSIKALSILCETNETIIGNLTTMNYLEIQRICNFSNNIPEYTIALS